jgi:hypothetical protein
MSALGIFAGLLMAMDDVLHGLSLSFAIAAGLAVCVASMHEELGGELRRLLRNRTRARRAYEESAKPRLTPPRAKG